MDSTQAFLASPVLWQETPNARIAYRRFGAGAPLVLVHGWPLCGFTFRKLIPYLAERFTVYVVDVPGGGDTEWTAGTDFSWPGQAQTMRAFADGLGLRDFFVYGQDSGAMIARQWVLIDPRILRLIMTNTEIPHHRPPFMRAFRLAMFLPGTNWIFRALLHWRWFVRSKLGFGGGFRDRGLIAGAFYDHVIKPLAKHHRRMVGHNRFLRGWDWKLLDQMALQHREIRIPVRMIWGADDATFPLARARDMVAQLPDCHGIYAIAGACVFVHEEKPAEVAAEVIRFAASEF